MIIRDAYDVPQSDWDIRRMAGDVLMGALKKCKATGNRHPALMNCHTISRMLGSAIPELIPTDGFVLGVTFIEDNQFKLTRAVHSWLVASGGSIIDPYPIGFYAPEPVFYPANKEFGPWGSDLFEESDVVAKWVSEQLEGK